MLFGIIVKVATNCAPHTPFVVLQPWNFFKPMFLKTTITFIFIFSFVRLGGNIFLLSFYPRFNFYDNSKQQQGSSMKNFHTNTCSGFYPNANDLNRNVPKVKNWVWKFKMFLKYHKDAIPNRLSKMFEIVIIKLNSFEKTFWWSCKYKSRSKKFTCPFRLVPMKFFWYDGNKISLLYFCRSLYCSVC
jgi:hypothetical protein